MIMINRSELLNGNSFITGVSGSGKSVLAKQEIINICLADKNADIIVIDPEREYRKICETFGGENIVVSAVSNNHVNAMDMNRDYGDGANPVTLKSEFMLSLCEQLMGSLDPKQKSIIDRCTALVYRDYLLGGCTGNIPTLKNFRELLLLQPEPEAKEIALSLELFTNGSLDTFANETNVNTNSRFICYDIRELGKQLMPTEMLELLAELKTRTDSEWIFPSPLDLSQPRHPAAVYHRFQKILERANCKRVRFHDLRHTFATMALENGMDIKTLSAMIGHVSAETTLNIYSHITDTMQQQAAARIDREIAGADTPIPEPTATDKASDSEATDQPTEPKFEPYKGKIRKPGTGCVTMINDHLFEGRFSPRVNGKRIARNIYATTREECEEKLKVLIAEMKKEIAEIKAGK